MLPLHSRFRRPFAKARGEVIPTLLVNQADRATVPTTHHGIPSNLTWTFKFWCGKYVGYSPYCWSSKKQNFVKKNNFVNHEYFGGFDAPNWLFCTKVFCPVSHQNWYKYYQRSNLQLLKDICNMYKYFFDKVEVTHFE